jgi:hypothetical protein
MWGWQVKKSDKENVHLKERKRHLKKKNRNTCPIYFSGRFTRGKNVLFFFGVFFDDLL